MRLNVSILLLFTACCVGRTYAKCSTEGISFWPNKPVVSTNSIFKVEGFGRSQKLVEELGKKCKIYLQCKKEKIPLKLISFYTGDFQLSQGFFRPIKALQVNKTYKIVIEGENDKWGYFERYNPTKEKWENVRWTVRSGADRSKPSWKKFPKFLKKTHIEYGCGPEIHADFLAAVSDRSEYLVKVVLVHLKTGRKTIYHLQTNEAKVEIGHDMCSGGFRFRHKEKYYAKLSLVDACGNHSKKTYHTHAFSMFNPNRFLLFK